MNAFIANNRTSIHVLVGVVVAIVAMVIVPDLRHPLAAGCVIIVTLWVALFSAGEDVPLANAIWKLVDRMFYR